MANPDLDYISYSAIRFELDLALMKKVAVKEETIGMNSQIWSRIPQELLLLVLTKLPTLIMRRFRAVCKQWKYLLSPAQDFQRILSTVTPCSSPAFLIIGQQPSWVTISHLDELYLLQSLPSPTRLPLDFLPLASRRIQASCKSLLCCAAYVNGEPTSFFICNPITRTWKTLPPATPLREPPHFIGMAFDTFRRICILLIGLINEERNNNVVMEIYDSETDTWTKLEMNIPISIFPRGEGIYSRGKFYWMSDSDTLTRDDLAAFDVAEKRWDVIGLPQRTILEDTRCHSYWKLTGYDGKVVLVDHRDLCLWKLNEDEDNARYRWLELQALPRSLYEEADKNAEGTGLKVNYAEVLVHSDGWVLVHLFGNKIVVFDAQGRLLQCVDGCLVRILERCASPKFLRAYEINNIWWP